MCELDVLSTVALLEDVAAPPLRRGQVGTVVERLAPRAANCRQWIGIGNNTGRLDASD
ncbi:MAG: DUF4926 domain-containing protein [Bryobacteraceae bacterium]